MMKPINLEKLDRIVDAVGMFILGLVLGYIWAYVVYC